MKIYGLHVATGHSSERVKAPVSALQTRTSFTEGRVASRVSGWNGWTGWSGGRKGFPNSEAVPRRTSPPTPSTTAGQHQPSGALAGEDGLGTTNDGCGGRGVAYRPGKGVGGRSCGCCKGMEGGRTKNVLIQTELNCVNFFDSRPIQKTFIFVDLV